MFTTNDKEFKDVSDASILNRKGKRSQDKQNQRQNEVMFDKFLRESQRKERAEQLKKKVAASIEKRLAKEKIRKEIATKVGVNWKRVIITNGKTNEYKIK